MSGLVAGGMSPEIAYSPTASMSGPARAIPHRAGAKMTAQIASELRAPSLRANSPPPNSATAVRIWTPAKRAPMPSTGSAWTRRK